MARPPTVGLPKPNGSAQLVGVADLGDPRTDGTSVPTRFF